MRHTIVIAVTHKSTRICKVQDPHLHFSHQCTYISYTTQRYTLRFIDILLHFFPSGDSLCKAPIWSVRSRKKNDRKFIPNSRMIQIVCFQFFSVCSYHLSYIVCNIIYFQFSYQYDMIQTTHRSRLKD